MFNRAIRGQCWLLKYLSSDNDPHIIKGRAFITCRFHQYEHDPITRLSGLSRIRLIFGMVLLTVDGDLFRA
jgi:hypothetical protein